MFTRSHSFRTDQDGARIWTRGATQLRAGSRARRGRFLLPPRSSAWRLRFGLPSWACPAAVLAIEGASLTAAKYAPEGRARGPRTLVLGVFDSVWFRGRSDALAGGFVEGVVLVAVEVAVEVAGGCSGRTGAGELGHGDAA